MLDFFTGFDHYATADLTAGVTARFTAIAFATVSSTAARTGANGLLVGNNNHWVKRTGLSNAATRVLGFAFRSPNTTAETRVIAALADGDPGTDGDVQVGLQLTAAGKLAVYRGRAIGNNAGGTQLGSDSANALSSNTWYFIELVVTVHNSTGTVEVYVNGTKAGWIDLTGQDTQSTANAYANAFGFQGTTGALHLDDLYCLSGTGGVRTTRLGDVKAVAVLPSTGNGAVAQFTPSTGTDRGALVDEAAPNGDTDYNESTSVANIDTYAFPALGSVGLIYGLNLHNFVKKTDAGTCDTQGVVRIGGTNYLQTQRAISTTYGYSSDLLEQSPATAADFTPSEVDGAEFGIKHAA